MKMQCKQKMHKPWIAKVAAGFFVVVVFFLTWSWQITMPMYGANFKTVNCSNYKDSPFLRSSAFFDTIPDGPHSLPTESRLGWPFSFYTESFLDINGEESVCIHEYRLDGVLPEKTFTDKALGAIQSMEMSLTYKDYNQFILFADIIVTTGLVVAPVFTLVYIVRNMRRKPRSLR